MKIDIVDMNLKSNQEMWEKQHTHGWVYAYSFPDFYMQRNDSDVYVFLYDDGKEKYESYEVYLRMPHANPHQIEETFYGADQEEAMSNMLKWIDEHINFLNELKQRLCEKSSTFAEK